MLKQIEGPDAAGFSRLMGKIGSEMSSKATPPKHVHFYCWAPDGAQERRDLACFALQHWVLLWKLFHVHSAVFLVSLECPLRSFGAGR